MYYRNFYSESMVTVPGSPPNIKSSFHHPQVSFVTDAIDKYFKENSLRNISLPY